MLSFSPVDVVTMRRLGADCFPPVVLELARLLLGALYPKSLLCSSTTVGGVTGAAGVIGATFDDPCGLFPNWLTAFSRFSAHVLIKFFVSSSPMVYVKEI